MHKGLTATCLILAMAAASAACAHPQAAAANRPVIRSQAQLAQYLGRTPAHAPPLGWLSPGGRKRFLAELQFGPRGLAGAPTDDPSHELTHDQLVALYALFDVAFVARDMPGLSPAEQARRQRERRAAAKARGCDTPDTCPESRIERQYDRLVLQKPDPDLPDARRAAWHAAHYDRVMGPLETADRLATADRPDLRLLKRAAEHVLFWNPETRYIDQLQAVLAEMQRRGMTRDRDYLDLYRALVAAREFRQAQALARRHPGMDVPTLPRWQAPSMLAPHQPTALSLSADGHTMTRQAFDLSAPLRMVIVASCHFSKDAARAIKRDPQLQAWFARHAIWLADERESIAEAENWNREFPGQPIHIAWHDSEWSKLDRWAMPTFYIFRHGKLIDHWSGWPADSGMRTLRRHLEQAGLP